MDPAPSTRQLSGAAEIGAALEAGAPIRLLVALREPRSAETADIVARAEQAGIPVWAASFRVIERYARTDPPPEVLALVGRQPDVGLEEMLATGDCVWLLSGIAYGSNAGFAIRTAEVAGAAGVVVDGDFNAASRREALRASMRSDRFLPVRFEASLPTLERARAAGYRIVGVEDVGTVAPWDVDLTGPVVFVIGGEKAGISPEVLARCDLVVRIPMEGFIPSYNLQGAVAAIAYERVRQEHAR